MGLQFQDAIEPKPRTKLGGIMTYTGKDGSVCVPSSEGSTVVACTVIFNNSPSQGSSFLAYQKDAGVLPNAFGAYTPMALQCALEELLPYSAVLVALWPGKDKLPEMQLLTPDGEFKNGRSITKEYWVDDKNTKVDALPAIMGFPLVSEEFVAEHFRNAKPSGLMSTTARYCDPKRNTEPNYPNFVPPTLGSNGFAILNDPVLAPAPELLKKVEYHVVAFGMHKAMGEHWAAYSDVGTNAAKGEAFLKEHFGGVLSGDAFYLLYGVAKNTADKKREAETAAPDKKRKAETAAPDESDDE